jgi:hypothetical protein
METNVIFLIPFSLAIFINTFSKCSIGMGREKKRENRRKEKKIVNYRIETCRRVLTSTPLYQVGAGTFVTYGLLFTN